MRSKSMWTDAHTRIAIGRILGVVLIIAGFIVLGIGWNGMARVSCPDCQLPYLISGGAVGLGLILLGIGMLVVVEIRSARDRIAERLDRLVGSEPGEADAGGVAEGERA